MIKSARRTRLIKYAIRDIAVFAQKLEKLGKKVIYLNIGDPALYGYHFPAKLFGVVAKASTKSASYADSLGVLEARQAIAQNWKKRRVSRIIAEDVIIGQGASELITLSLGALINWGENILVPYPGYPLYNSSINLFEGKVNPYYLTEKNNWQPNITEIEKKINKKTRAIVIINPGNPTGNVIKANCLKKIISLAIKHKLLILSDETYDQFVFKKNIFVPLISLSKTAPIVTFNSLSKSHFVPGWRVGWLTFSGPDAALNDYREAVKKLARARLSAVHPFQYAIKPALADFSHLNKAVKGLQKKAEQVVSRINEIKGLSCSMPQASFYLFVRIALPIKSDEDFVKDLLKKEGVLVVPGSGFGQEKGTFHFRMVLLPEMAVLITAINKIERFINKNY